MDYLGEFDQIVRILMEMRDAKLYSIIQINLIIHFVKPRFITVYEKLLWIQFLHTNLWENSKFKFVDNQQGHFWHRHSETTNFNYMKQDQVERLTFSKIIKKVNPTSLNISNFIFYLASFIFNSQHTIKNFFALIINWVIMEKEIKKK